MDNLYFSLDSSNRLDSSTRQIEKKKFYKVTSRLVKIK